MASSPPETTPHHSLVRYVPLGCGKPGCHLRAPLALWSPSSPSQQLWQARMPYTHSSQWGGGGAHMDTPYSRLGVGLGRAHDHCKPVTQDYRG